MSTAQASGGTHDCGAPGGDDIWRVVRRRRWRSATVMERRPASARVATAVQQHWRGNGTATARGRWQQRSARGRRDAAPTFCCEPKPSHTCGGSGGNHGATGGQRSWGEDDGTATGREARRLWGGGTW
eukprot:5180944-Pleurochrysis_carterae.AAC.1